MFTVLRLHNAIDEQARKKHVELRFNYEHACWNVIVRELSKQRCKFQRTVANVLFNIHATFVIINTSALQHCLFGKEVFEKYISALLELQPRN